MSRVSPLGCRRPRCGRFNGKPRRSPDGVLWSAHVGRSRRAALDKPLFPPNLARIRRVVNSRRYLDRRCYRVVTFGAVRYVVLGCGAIGGTIAAGLARDGHDVLVSDASPDVVSAVAARGIRITGPVESFVAPVTAVAPAGLPERLDCPVLIAVKAHHTAAAVASVAGRLTDGGFVVSLQNGLNNAVLSDAVGPERVVEACVNFGADALEPGVILRGNRATLMIGEIDGTLSDRVRALVADIADAQVTDNVLGYLWAKEAYGAMLAATAVSDLPIAEVLENPRWAPLLTEIARQGQPLNGVAAVIGAPERAAAGPLAGQPVAVKDIIAVEGVPTRCGSPASDPVPAAADALLVRRLRAAGAEVFAASQCLEYAAGFALP